MRKKLTELHPMLAELLLGILFFGVLLELLLIWFSSNKLLFTSGLWIGVFLSVLGVVHMYHTLDVALDLVEEDAQKHLRKGHALRFVIVIAVFLAVYYWKLGNVLAFFLGILTLKFSAYVQPVTHRILTKKKKGG